MRSFRTFFLFTIPLIILCCVSSSAFSVDIFNHKRVSINKDLIAGIPGDGGTQRELKLFGEKYTSALRAISSGDYDTAEADLQAARDIWPEYFHMDLLLGMLYEREGNYTLAARYYKTYLKKLKRYEDGWYRMSAPVMRSLSLYGIERYDEARAAVVERLMYFDIDLRDVRTVVSLPEFFWPLVFAFLLAALFIIGHYVIIPGFKRHYRITHPAEGFWVCPHCETPNPNLANVCEGCNRPKPR